MLPCLLLMPTLLLPLFLLPGAALRAGTPFLLRPPWVNGTTAESIL